MKHIFFIVLLFSSLLIYCNKKDFKIIIENKSDETINSLILNVQDKTFKVDKIEASKHSIIIIPFSSININAHDFRIESRFNLSDGKLNKGFYYSDLSGTPNPKYVIAVYDTNTVIK
ncbi:hypothetical protein [Hydrotalea sandarakina]|uniref:Uncharacterized protein n=1 Tax=Hydrotalea sandarakina TaxID=1004304 RepID=A0A2W7TN93_9BACT|nr:hypothetical protein [Hydrotalea sandarakina]PZX64632.1 hypothetical protein LX80_00829 [Hydrotalea sandarakina]